MKLHEALALAIATLDDVIQQMDRKIDQYIEWGYPLNADRQRPERDELAQAADLLRALPDDLDALRAAVEALLTDGDGWSDIIGPPWFVQCRYCNQITEVALIEQGKLMDHMPGCPVKAARAALARMEGNAR